MSVPNLTSVKKAESPDWRITTVDWVFWGRFRNSGPGLPQTAPRKWARPAYSGQASPLQQCGDSSCFMRTGRGHRGPHCSVLPLLLVLSPGTHSLRTMVLRSSGANALRLLNAAAAAFHTNVIVPHENYCSLLQIPFSTRSCLILLQQPSEDPQ
jgi:hypothetical protein